jgi:di/tripeptidase
MKLVELNDFAMKGMVYKTSKEEFRKGVDIMTEQVKRVMAKYKKKANAKTSAEH